MEATAKRAPQAQGRLVAAQRHARCALLVTRAQISLPWMLPHRVFISSCESGALTDRVRHRSLSASHGAAELPELR